MGFSPAYATEYSLSSAEGALVSVAIRVEPQRLEDLLEALAQVAFPINPQIYHEAEIKCRKSDGQDAIQVTTLVEFPAYLARVEDALRTLETNGFERQDVLVNGMLEELRGPNQPSRVQSKAGWTIRARQHSTRGN
jgi:hypothetical protein